MNLYEGMFLLDNQVVRADWAKAKSLVLDTIAKHGGAVETARRWDERKLCYPIAGKKRATYLLCYYRMDNEGIAGMRRDFELSENVLRYLLLRVEEVPQGEIDKSNEENADGFSFPMPPEDDEPEHEPEPPAEEKAEEKAPEASKDAKDGEQSESGDEATDEAKPDTETPSEKVEA